MKFELDEQQTKKANEWMTKLAKDNANAGAIGGRFSFEFANTGIGTLVKIKDAVTKQELDLTDYSGW